MPQPEPSPEHDPIADPEGSGSVPSTGPFLGRVTSFDAQRGLGTVTDTKGSAFAFHATAIGDGSRRIDLGTDVSFVVAAGHCGRYEARALTVVGSISHHLPA